MVLTRSKSVESEKRKGKDKKFPPVYTRTGYRSMNEDLMRCTTQCLADHKVNLNDLSGIMTKTANIVFGQQWELSEDDEEDPNEDNDEDESSDRMLNKFPCRRTLNAWLEDASYLNLKFVAENILYKEDNVVGVGDTSKAVGHKLYNVKAITSQ